MALILSPPNPLGLLGWEDGHSASTAELRCFKNYIAGRKLALLCADTVEVVRVGYGGFDHRTTTKYGVHLSTIVDPPDQLGVLAEAIRLREAGFPVRGEYRHNPIPVIRFFARITEDQDWGMLAGMTPAYERVPPYARIGTLADISPPVKSPSPRMIRTESEVLTVRNMTTSPMLALVSTATWIHSFLFWSKTFWHPAVSVLTISFLLYRVWQQLEVIMSLMPSQEKVTDMGWAGALILMCMATALFIYVICVRWLFRRYPSIKSPKTPNRQPAFVPPPESSPSTSLDPRVSEPSLESLLVHCPGAGLEDGPSPSVAVSARTGCPREMSREADSVFLVGEFAIPLGEAMRDRTDTGEYLLIGGDFALGGKGRLDGDDRFICLCRARGADYLDWFDQVNCMAGGCMKKGVSWDREWVTQGWRPAHLETNLFQTQEGSANNTNMAGGVASAFESEEEPSPTPCLSERERERRNWNNSFDEYRLGDEKLRATCAADIHRVILEGVKLQTASKSGDSKATAANIEEESDTGKIRASLDGIAGQKPSRLDAETSREGRSSGSVSWDDLEKAWNIDPNPIQEEGNLEFLRTKHCKERKARGETGERRASCLNSPFSFPPEAPGRASRRSSPMEEVLLGESTGGAGMRNQEWLPRFLQKPQTEGTEVPAMMRNDCQPSAGVNEWSTVTDALTNVLFDGMADRGDD